MPLSKILLKSEIKSAIISEFASDGIEVTDEASAAWERVATAIATAVVDHITTNAVVSTTGTASAQTGVIT